MTATHPEAPAYRSAGARPEGAASEREAAARVREMFGGIAPRYDLLNHVLSLNLDRAWRRRVARRFSNVLARADARVLDLCCGTGDLTLALARRGPARVIGSDFAHPMLLSARRKSGAGAGAAANYVEADALHLPFADGTFDLVTAAFGFRNLGNYDCGLREIHRVLKPGGQVGILEFAEPKSALFGSLYRFYFTRMLPVIGGMISGSRAAYTYLPASVGKFPSPEELAARMSAAGFVKPSCELWTGGSVALHSATKQ